MWFIRFPNTLPSRQIRTSSGSSLMEQFNVGSDINIRMRESKGLGRGLLSPSALLTHKLRNGGMFCVTHWALVFTQRFFKFAECSSNVSYFIHSLLTFAKSRSMKPAVFLSLSLTDSSIALAEIRLWCNKMARDCRKEIICIIDIR